MRAFDPHALECLAAILEEGSFDRAAARLSITQSAVSQRLRALEVAAGTVLVVRSRPLRATSAGRLMLRHAMQMRLLRADLEQDLHGLVPGKGVAETDELISIAINADSIATWALPALTPLVATGLALEIIADDQDFTHGWLREGHVVGCITGLAQASRGCRVAHLGSMRYVAVASAEYARQRAPRGITGHNLHELAFIAFNRKDDLQARFVRRAIGHQPPQLNQRFVPSSNGQVRAVLDGWGVSVVPEMQVRNHLQDGSLINLNPTTNLPVDLYWHCWNLSSPRLSALTNALAAAASELLV